ncbi:DUF4856 domain-containing protein [Capnocytophaga canis]|uniref:DUF4856 domain-containing protein n=1 Tax=Capnocytophaga canis TaxID=1848903 RepID=UPI00370D1B89
MRKYTLFTMLLMLVACNKGEGETVESAYLEPLPPEYKYSFSRNGSSSVDLLECSLLKEPLDVLYNSYLKEARIMNQADYQVVFRYYNDGIYSHLKPKEEVAKSELHRANREAIQKDLTDFIETSARIGGYGTENPSDIRRQALRQGRTGYIGNNIGDVNLAFADEKGIVVAEAFRYAIFGAIYLDKALNYHLDESFLNNETLRKKHEDVVLPPGRNYTELEHHWDLAYGYYTFLRPLVRAEGIPLLKNSEVRIFNAFVQGRIELERYRYEDMKQHLHIIREELSRAIAIRTMNILIGENTLANLDERGGYAFPFISRAYGLIYALQFARNPQGELYYSREEVQRLLQQFLLGNGLWDKDRLFSDAQTQGSLKHIATEVGKPFGISIEQIKR